MSPDATTKDAGYTQPPEPLFGDSGAGADHDARFSCNECKRRRLKCTREIPICHLCAKYNRHCLYEKKTRTPLTRKHLTKVEEELNLSQQLLEKYLPEVDISVLLQQLRNGADIGSIPLLANLNPRKRTGGHLDHSSEETVSNSASGPASSTDSHAAALALLLNIQSLLTDDTKALSAYRDDTNDYQIPQLLPSSVNINTKGKRRREDKALDTSPASNSSTYNWDERNQTDDHRQTSIIDGMATTETNGYLGAASSAALINLVSDGFFLHSNRKDSTDRTLSASPTDSWKLKQKISRQRLEYYINQYFETYHVLYPIIHRAMFVAQFNEIITPPAGWDSLLYIVAALGCFMSAVSPDDNDDLVLFEIAKSKLCIEVLETGNLTLVQTITLMSNYLQKRDRPNSGYNYLGLAVRMALGLGMHKDIENPRESLLDHEMRRRVWWCLYIFDCGQTITYGRPLGIPCAGIDTKLPMNILDSSLTTLTLAMPDEEHEPTIYSSLRLQSLFHILTNSIYERIITDPFPSAFSLLNWDRDYVERWKALVPGYFSDTHDVVAPYQLAHRVLEWRYRNLRILMYRTFLLKNVVVHPKGYGHHPLDEFEARAGEICLQECDATITSMDRFWTHKATHNRMDAWYTLFFLIPAVLMPLVCLRNNPTSANAEYWRIEIVTAQSIIRSLMAICPTASNILDLIDSLGFGYIRTSGQDENATFSYEKTGTDESPTSQLMLLHGMLWPSFDLEQQFNLS